MPLAKVTYLDILLIACFHVIEMTILLDIFEVAVEQTYTVSNKHYICIIQPPFIAQSVVLTVLAQYLK